MSYIEKIEFAKRMNKVADLLGIPEKGKNRQMLLGKKFGVSQEAARKWLSGESIPRDQICIAIAKEADINYEWLKTGRGNIKNIPPAESKQKITKNEEDSINDPLFSIKARKIDITVCPLISWVRAGEMCSSDGVYDFDDAKEWRFCPVKHSEKCFVLTIAGTSMEPDYTDGSEIFVDPLVEPLHNDDVVVCDTEGKATFKRLKITQDGKYLEALNPDYPNRIIQVPEGTIICGVVIYSGRKTR